MRNAKGSSTGCQIGQIPLLDRFLLGNPLLAILRPVKQKSGGILNVRPVLDLKTCHLCVGGNTTD